MVNSFYAFYEVSFVDRKEGRMIVKVTKNIRYKKIKIIKFQKKYFFKNCQVINFKNEFENIKYFR